MKNIKKYLKLHQEEREKSYQKWGYYHLFCSWEEFEKWNENTWQEHLQKYTDNNSIEKTKMYISLLNDLKKLGFYLAFEQNDFRLLNDVLFQTARQELLDTSITSSGTDHCNAFFESLSAFACNDFEVIESLFPKDLPPSSGQYYTENAVNLLKTMYFQQENLKKEAIQRAEAFLQKKITAWEKFVVLYMMALVEKNAQKASDYLQELCSAYQKLGYPRQKIDKLFAQEIHGLYRLARKLDQDLFEQIKMPSHDCFFQDFEHWQRQNHYPKGKILYFYSPKMAYINHILEVELPKIELYEQIYSDKRKYIFKNVEKFAADLTKSVLKSIEMA